MEGFYSVLLFRVFVVVVVVVVLFCFVTEVFGRPSREDSPYYVVSLLF